MTAQVGPQPADVACRMRRGQAAGCCEDVNSHHGLTYLRSGSSLRGLIPKIPRTCLENACLRRVTAGRGLVPESRLKGPAPGLVSYIPGAPRRERYAARNMDSVHGPKYQPVKKCPSGGSGQAHV